MYLFLFDFARSDLQILVLQPLSFLQLPFLMARDRVKIGFKPPQKILHHSTLQRMHQTSCAYLHLLFKLFLLLFAKHTRAECLLLKLSHLEFLQASKFLHLRFPRIPK